MLFVLEKSIAADKVLEAALVPPVIVSPDTKSPVGTVIAIVLASKSPTEELDKLVNFAVAPLVPPVTVSET